MSRTQSDQVIDDDESETCPLCIEEFDISDYNFFPCPCGYQVCQFCYNNIKTTMNGLCPACRRVYDDKNIRWKQLTQEEIKSHQETVAQQAKKKAAAKQKEAAKREADSLSRKHLAGIRVRQKNLVYITGMRPTSNAEHLSEILRRDEYFGQYGKIVKIVVSKAKDTTVPNPAVGVYVTFETKEAAARCIHSVDATQNYDTRLRAQYGTTKYCSAYLRGDTCGKKDCMFLHEPGDENESFSRQDLSSMNVISTQTSAGGSAASAQHQAPPQQGPRSIAAASQAVDRSDGDSASQADSADGSGLPPSASWAARPPPSRKASQHQALSTATASPKMAHSVSPLQSTDSKSSSKPRAEDASDKSVSDAAASAQPSHPQLHQSPAPRTRLSVLRTLSAEFLSGEGGFSFDESSVDGDDLELFKILPLFFDPNGAARRRQPAKQNVEPNIHDTDNQVASQALSAIDPDENPASGSLQLGGEPEDNGDGRQRQGAIRPPSLDQISSPVFGVEQTVSPASNAAGTARGMTPQQQQQQHLLLQSFKSGSPSYGGPGQAPSHARQTSRFSFANDVSASANVKPVANQKLMNQQISMLPSGTQHAPLPHSQSGSQVFSSGIQGPPPGLKATGTPPVSGGGMFGQGHGFATAGLNYGVNAPGRNANDEMMRELLRNRGGSAGSGPTSEAARRDLADPSILQARMHQAGAGQGSYPASGSQGQGQARTATPLRSSFDLSRARWSATSSPSAHGSRKSTPTPALPPGIPLPLGSRLDGYDSPDRGSGAELVLMPELGRLPESSPAVKEVARAAFKKPAAPGLKAASPLASVASEKQSDAGRSPQAPSSDETAFPALPKPRPSTASSSDTAASKRSLGRGDGKPPVKLATKVDTKAPPLSSTTAATATTISKETPKPPSLNTAVSAKSLDTEAQPTAQSSRPSSSGSLVTSDARSPASKSPFADSPVQAPDNSSKNVSQRRTLRVLAQPTPKPEATQADSSAVSISTTPAVVKPIASKPAKHSSRQASVASLAVSETPTSEKPDDTMSMTTESVSASRANSPPPGSKIGSAPLRTKTKSQQKKERQERAKGEPGEVESPVAAEPVMQEPIIGRKKKSKKPAAAAPPPPPPPAKMKEVPEEPPPPPVPSAQPAEETLPTPTPEQAEIPQPQPQPQPEKETDTPPPQTDRDADALGEKADPAKKAALYAQQIIDPLVKSGEIDPAVLNFFKGAHGFPSLRHDFTAADLLDIPPGKTAPLTAEEEKLLNAGKPVRRNDDDDDAAAASPRTSLAALATRVLITPHTRHCVHGLPRELEDRLLELEARVRASRPPQRYSHRPSSTAAAATEQLISDMLKDMAAGLAPRPAAAPRPPPATTSKSPTRAPAPAYADDALAYLNQFILPASARRAPASLYKDAAAGAGADIDAAPISSGIPRTYTTGDPTYSVSGVDVASSPADAPPGGADFASTAEAILKQLPPIPDAAALQALCAGHTTHDALAASLGAASSSLASVAQAAVAAAGSSSAAAALSSREILSAGAEVVRRVMAREERAGAGGAADEAARAVAETERRVAAARREAEALEKRMGGLARRNRRVAGV